MISLSQVFHVKHPDIQILQKWEGDVGFRDVKRSKSVKGTRIIAIINQKGGVGKSTTAVNLAAALGEQNKKTLVVDFDPQGNTTSGFGIEKEELENCVYDALLHDVPAEQIIQDTDCKKVFVIPATIQLAGAEIELVSTMARETRLRTCLNQLSTSLISYSSTVHPLWVY